MSNQNSTQDVLFVAPAPVPDGYVLVPQRALDWLHGEGPDDDGIWFGDAERVAGSGSFWWRTVFRRMCALTVGEPALPGGDDVAHEAKR